MIFVVAIVIGALAGFQFAEWISEAMQMGAKASGATLAIGMTIGGGLNLLGFLAAMDYARR